MFSYSTQRGSILNIAIKEAYMDRSGCF